MLIWIVSLVRMDSASCLTANLLFRTCSANRYEKRSTRIRSMKIAKKKGSFLKVVV